MKIITLDGRVGANGTEVKFTKNGKPYARFSVANNSFVNGEEKTDWFDIISYDPTFIEKRAQYLGKGSYVIITGSIRTEVKVGQDNKVWVNHYVTATNIDTPRLGGKPENQNTSNTNSKESLSTFTGGTKSDFVAEVKATPNIDTHVTQDIPQPHFSTAEANASMFGADTDDLPF